MRPDPGLSLTTSSELGDATDVRVRGESAVSVSEAPSSQDARRAPLDFSRRAQLTERMDEPCSRETMRACLRDLARVNRLFRAYRPVLDWLQRLRKLTKTEPLRILDVGCGYGDTLRAVEEWATRHEVAVQLTGLDLNPDTVSIAKEATPANSGIEWVVADVFQYRAPHAPHLIISSLFTHHLSDVDAARFLRWMEEQATVGWFVNDLSRAAAPYYLFRWFARLAGFHPFVQHDGPVSIARAFSPNDWRRLAVAAGLAPSTYSLVAYKPARLCVRREKPQSA